MHQGGCASLPADGWLLGAWENVSIWLLRHKSTISVLVPSNRRGLCFSARTPSVLQATSTHQQPGCTLKLGIYWAKPTGYLLRNIFTEEQCPCQCHGQGQGLGTLLSPTPRFCTPPGAGNGPRDLLHVEERGCSQGWSCARFGALQCWWVGWVLWDSADPSSINKADNTCLLHGAGEIKHNRRRFYSLKTTQVPQWQITFDKHWMGCLGIQPGVLCKAQ